MTMAPPRTTAGVIIVLFLAAAVLKGCDAGFGSPDCQEQERVAKKLAAARELAEVSVAATSVASYEDYPCKEGSGGSTITAGKRFTLERSMSFDELRSLANAIAVSASWTRESEIAPSDPGSGGDAHICYVSINKDNETYLRFHAVDSKESIPNADQPPSPPSPLLFIEISETGKDATLCGTAKD
jgi:hypothetical protein